LRAFFEIDAPHIAAAVLAELAVCGDVTGKAAAKAIAELGIDPETTGPLAVS
jgi:pyruvate dehydrogenase complex dehydrogenase (E1) component